MKLGSKLLVVAAVVACVAYADSKPKPGKVKWGYAESAAPEQWAVLSGNGACAGKKQTPIALATAAAKSEPLPKPTFSYAASKLSMLNNGHTVQFGYDAGSTLSVSGATYKLAQFHFHTPSEHTLDGVSYPLELHLVHLDASGKPALVVGVFVKAGAASASLDTAFKNLPQHGGDRSEPAGATLNAQSLLPADRTFFKYDGSLTTPPCTEGLQWYVMKQPIEMSEAQLLSYQAIAHLNPSNRPIQPLNGRGVSLSSAP